MFVRTQRKQTAATTKGSNRFHKIARARTTTPQRRKLTARGFACREVAKALDDAISAADAERACCLAAELAAATGRGCDVESEDFAMREVADKLVDVFAAHYATVDASAVHMIAEAISTMSSVSSSRDERRAAMCDAVVSLAMGLPRQEASAQILASAYRACGSASTESRTTGDDAALGDYVRRGRTYEAVLKANRESMLTVDSCLSMWRACSDVVDCVGGKCRRAHWQRTFVEDARTLFFHGPQSNTKAVRVRRTSLALCAVLVASSRHASGTPPSTWAGPRADAAIASARSLIGGVFSDIYCAMTGESDPAADGGTERSFYCSDDEIDDDAVVENEIAAFSRSHQQHQQHQQQQIMHYQNQGLEQDEQEYYEFDHKHEHEHEHEPEHGSEDPGRPIDYWQVYTTINYGAIGRVEDARYASRANTVDLAPVKTVVLK